MLDFGCAEGIYLDYLVAEGHSRGSLTGVDISPQMVDVVKSKGFAGYTIDEQLPAGEFDLITLWDVIEHVPSPPDTFNELSKALAPGGKILLETPRVGLLSDIMGERFEHYLPIEHLHLFTREALVATAERAGLKLARGQELRCQRAGHTDPGTVQAGVRRAGEGHRQRRHADHAARPRLTGRA